MKGFLWIAACGAAVMVGTTVREGPAIIDTISQEISIENDGESIRIGGRDRGDSEFDRAQADIDAALAGEAVEASVTSEDLEASISEATEAIAAANERIAEIEADESLSAEARTEALAQAREARSEAIQALQRAVPGDSRDVDAEEQIVGGIEQMVLGIVTAAEESGAKVERDGRVLTGEERAKVFADARAEIRDEFDND